MWGSLKVWAMSLESGLLEPSLFTNGVTTPAGILSGSLDCCLRNKSSFLLHISLNRRGQNALKLPTALSHRRAGLSG